MNRFFRLPAVLVRRPNCILLCIAWILAVSYADFRTNPELTLDILYLIPVAIAAWNLGTHAGIWIALLAGMSWCAAQHFSGYQQESPAVFWWNAFMLQAFFLLTSTLFSRLRSAQDKLSLQKREIESANAQLSAAVVKLRVLDQRKDEFLAICGHDIRGPLAGNIAGMQILLTQMHGPLNEKQREVVERNLNGARAVIRLTNDLLDMARIEAGQEALNLERFDLLATVSDCIKSQRDASGDQRVRVDLCAARGNFEIEADRMKVARICNNLLSNAVKHSPAGGVVKVALDSSNDGVRMAIADSGPGIAPENMDALFDKYSGLARHAQTRDEGTGLGLSITRTLVNLHGGSIDVSSEYGKGATFRVTIPTRSSESGTGISARARILESLRSGLLAPG